MAFIDFVISFCVLIFSSLSSLWLRDSCGVPEPLTVLFLIVSYVLIYTALIVMKYKISEGEL